MEREGVVDRVVENVSHVIHFAFTFWGVFVFLFFFFAHSHGCTAHPVRSINPFRRYDCESAGKDLPFFLWALVEDEAAIASCIKHHIIFLLFVMTDTYV